MKNEDVLKEFLFDCTMRKLSERTLKGYKNNNLGLFRFLKNEYQMTELEEIHHKAIQSYIQFLTDKKLKETYINGLIKSFRAYFRYCYEEKYIEDSTLQKLTNLDDLIELVEQEFNEVTTVSDLEYLEFISMMTIFYVQEDSTIDE